MSGSGPGSPRLHHACAEIAIIFKPPQTPLEIQFPKRREPNRCMRRGRLGRNSNGVHTRTSPTPPTNTNGLHHPELHDLRSPPSCRLSHSAPEAPTTDASRVQLVHVHLCGASPCRWVLARRVCTGARKTGPTQQVRRFLPDNPPEQTLLQSTSSTCLDEEVCIDPNELGL